MFDTEVVGDLAYVAGNLTGLQIYDMSDPANPVELSVVPMPERAWSVDVVGQYAYVGANFDGLYVVDISDPESPVITDSIGLYGATHSVEVVDSIAYVGVGMGGLQLIDVSDPYDIEFRSVYDNTDRYGGSIQVSYADSERVYCTDDVRGIFEIDVTDPENPTRRHVIQLPRRSTGVGVSDRLVASAIQLTNIVYFFERDRLPPSPLIGSVSAAYEACSMDVRGDLVFVADCREDIYVFDVEDRVHPVVATTIPMPFAVNRIRVVGDTLYVLMESMGLVSLDISDLERPIYLDVLRFDDHPSSLEVNDGIAYITADKGRFWLVDLSDPADLRIAGTYEIEGDASQVIVDRSRVYFSSYKYGDPSKVYITDTTNPAQIVTLGSFEVPNSGWVPAVQNGIALIQYYVQNTSMTEILDVTNPKAIQVIRPAFEFGATSGMVWNGTGILSLASGLHQYDIADFFDIKFQGYFTTGETMRPMRLLDQNTAVVYGQTNGLMIVNVGDTCSGCLPDTNRDGILSPADFTAWIAAFNAQGARCDQNADGLCTPADFSAWIANFNAGCD